VAELVIEKGIRFWRDHVLADIAPPVSGLDCDTEWLKEVFPKDSGEVVFSSPEIDRAAEKMMGLLGQANPLYKEAKEYENQIREFMGAAAGLETIIGRFTWTNTKDSQVTDWEALARENVLATTADAAALIAKYTTTKPGSRRFNKPRGQ
jgi:hypothetical protein